MEYLIALLGIGLALWMIVSACNRSRRPPEERHDGEGPRNDRN